MPKTPNQEFADTEQVQATAAESFDVSLDEFCVRRSTVDKRVELLAAFHAVERGAGRVKDSDAAYAARYAAFQNQPV